MMTVDATQRAFAVICLNRECKTMFGKTFTVGNIPEVTLTPC